MKDVEAGNRESRSGLYAVAVMGLAVVGLMSKQGARGVQPAPQAAAASPGSDSTAVPTTHPPGIIGIGRSVIDRIGNDNITLVAAGIAFYVMLAIFPALAVMVSIYGLVGDPADVGRRISDYGGLLPPEALKLITDGLQAFAQKSTSQLSLALVTGVVLALWSARAGMSSVMSGLNIAYEETEKRSFIVQNLVALGLTLAGVVFAILIVLAVAVVPIVLNFLHLSDAAAVLVNIARWPVLALLILLAFAVLYRYAASRSHARWRWISYGSAVATLLWLIGSFLFSFYVSRFGSYDATYGALGGVVVLLLWFWVSATILLVGAEIDSELELRANQAGSPTGGAATSIKGANPMG